MSVLIKGMEVPKSCYVCPFCDYVSARCDAVKGTPYTPTSRYDTRAEWCPLVPVPDHGDLIDRDKLREKEFINDGDAYAVVMSRDIRTGIGGLKMAEYTEKSTVLAIIGKHWRSKMYADDAIQAALDEIANLPAADVQPVRHGRYITDDMGDSSCSECGERYLDVTQKYCPNCGAKLDLEAQYK